MQSTCCLNSYTLALHCADWELECAAQQLSKLEALAFAVGEKYQYIVGYFPQWAWRVGEKNTAFGSCTALRKLTNRKMLEVNDFILLRK
jgi:hypothetical protein